MEANDMTKMREALASEANLKLANRFHRVVECGIIEPPKKGGAK